jgi:hypothetical protein
MVEVKSTAMKMAVVRRGTNLILRSRGCVFALWQGDKPPAPPDCHAHP